MSALKPGDRVQVRVYGDAGEQDPPGLHRGRDHDSWLVGGTIEYQVPQDAQLEQRIGAKWMVACDDGHDQAFHERHLNEEQPK